MNGSTAWLLFSAALVMLMTLGLAFFYGGMVRSKNVLNMLMMSFFCLSVVSVLWALYGYSLAFGENVLKGLVGLNHNHLNPDDVMVLLSAKDPRLAFAMFQLMFAILTPALVSGVIADQARLWATWTLFVA